MREHLVWHCKGPVGCECLKKLNQRGGGEDPHTNADSNKEEKKKNPESWRHRPVTRLAEVVMESQVSPSLWLFGAPHKETPFMR